MPKKKKQTERRKHKRFRVVDDTYANFGSSKYQCSIIDISLEGLSFRYFSETREIKGFSPTDTGKLDIIKTNDHISIQQIPFETVYDIEVESENPWHSFKTRRRGLRFIRLTRKQRSQLESFIKEHTVALSKECASEEI